MSKKLIAVGNSIWYRWKFYLVSHNCIIVAKDCWIPSSNRICRCIHVSCVFHLPVHCSQPGSRIQVYALTTLHRTTHTHDIVAFLDNISITNISIIMNSVQADILSFHYLHHLDKYSTFVNIILRYGCDKGNGAVSACAKLSAAVPLLSSYQLNVSCSSFDAGCEQSKLFIYKQLIGSTAVISVEPGHEGQAITALLFRSWLPRAVGCAGFRYLLSLLWFER